MALASFARRQLIFLLPEPAPGKHLRVGRMQTRIRTVGTTVADEPEIGAT